jgi:hypothetical protein
MAYWFHTTPVKQIHGLLQFDIIDGEGKNAWIKGIRLFDYDQDGDIDIVADGLFGVLEGDKGRRIYWRNDSGKFKQVNL